MKLSMFNPDFKMHSYKKFIYFVSWSSQIWRHSNTFMLPNVWEAVYT